MYRTSGSEWNINGDVTGGSAGSILYLLGNSTVRPLVFNGDVQDFF